MPSRISGACTPCRSKKQKCSGHHPTCTQCANTSVDCTWPEQRKRGPAKGYIEALESRLHNAESLLLAVLPLVDDTLVDGAVNILHRDVDEDADGIAGRRSSPPLLNKKTGLEYWDSFPIDTTRNIRKWQYDCEANSAVHPPCTTTTTTTTTRESSSMGRTKLRSPSRSPRSGGIASPPSSISVSAASQPSHWIQSVSPYVGPSQMQAGAAQQLLSLSTQQGDHWMSTVPQQSPDPMQLDPGLMQSGSHHRHHNQNHHPPPPPLPPHHYHHRHHDHIPRPVPPPMYAGTMQQSLFW